MKKRLHNKKAGIAILLSLIVIALAEIIFRAAAMGLEAVLTTANLGEQLAVVVLAATILILTAKGKDRACYILYGAWIGYFVFDQIFELPGAIVTIISSLNPNVVVPGRAMGVTTNILFVLSSIIIIAIGALLVEYMTDGTIYNRVFNVLCVLASVMLLCTVAISVYGAITTGLIEIGLGAFNNLYHLVMVFLFAFFAYDSAKMQLKKTNLTK